MSKTGYASIILLGSLLISSCSSQLSDLPSTPSTSQDNIFGQGQNRVAGYVVSAGGGAAVPGSAITVKDADGKIIGTATTDEQGKFFIAVNPGTYTLEFKKSGYAASTVENYPIYNSTQQLNVIQKTVFSSKLSIGAPKINMTALRGDQELKFPMRAQDALSFKTSEGIPLHLITHAIAEDVSPVNIYLAVGLENVPGSQLLGDRFYDGNDPKNTTYDKTILLPDRALRGQSGETYLNVVVYDSNNNRTNTYIPIKIIVDQNVESPLGSFINTTARAITVAQKIGFQSIGPQTAPTELSTIWVDLNFDYQSGLQGDLLGYRVFTSDDDKTYHLLKTLPATASIIRDSSPSLSPDKPVYYYIQAFNSVSSINSRVLKTTPLGSFLLSDLGPTNHSKNISVKPKLTWKINQKIGDYRKFLVMVNDYPSQGEGCFWGGIHCGDTSEEGNNIYTDDGKTPALNTEGLYYSVQFNENGKAREQALLNGHSYTMDLSAAAFRADGSAISIAQDYYKVFYDLPICNFGGPVCEGQLSTFTTGDGSY